MILLAIALLSAWTLASLAAGLGLGAVIRVANRVQKEEFLESLFSTLAERQMAR